MVSSRVHGYSPPSIASSQARQIVQPLFEQRKIYDAEIVRGGVLLILRVAAIFIAIQARKLPVEPAKHFVAFQPQSAEGPRSPPPSRCTAYRIGSFIAGLERSHLPQLWLVSSAP